MNHDERRQRAEDRIRQLAREAEAHNDRGLRARASLVKALAEGNSDKAGRALRTLERGLAELREADRAARGEMSRVADAGSQLSAAMHHGVRIIEQALRKARGGMVSVRRHRAKYKGVRVDSSAKPRKRKGDRGWPQQT